MGKKWFYAFAILLVCLSLFLPGAASAGSAMPLTGEWAFSYEPETPVLRISGDGTAWYQDRELTWEAGDGFLRLKDGEGRTETLRYLITEERKFIYPRTAYHRGKEVEGQGGLIGIWEGVNGGSSFVFTPAGYFLEDSSFSGNFMIDEEDGTFLLHYGDVFADTLCYYTIDENEILTVEYPWEIVELKKNP